jgi:hypothetical protein
MHAEKATLELVRRLELAPGLNRMMLTSLRDDELLALLAGGPVHAVLDGDRVVALVGAIRQTNGCAIGFAIVGPAARRSMIGICRSAAPSWARSPVTPRPKCTAA